MDRDIKIDKIPLLFIDYGGNMFKKYILLLFVCMGGVSLVQAQIQQIRDVRPNDTVTSLEFTPSMDVLDDSRSTSLSKMTAKGYYHFAPNLTAGLELPFARFESPVKNKNGLGDITVSLSMGQYNLGQKWAFGAGIENIIPTATADELGSGKFQLNPSIYGVYSPNRNWFLALGYKQYWSIMGNGNRDDINQARIRGVLAYLSDTNWWVLLDPRYYIDYNNTGVAKFQPEIEVGTMINVGTALYLRSGGKMGGNMPGEDWTISMGFRVLYL